MKRYFFFVALAALAACSKTPQGPSAWTLSAWCEALSEDMVLKSNVSDAGKFIWHDWDKAAVWTTENTFATLSVLSGGGTNTVSFLATLPEGVKPAKVAVYPDGVHQLAGDVLTVNYPAEYTYPADTTDSCPVMIARYLEGSGLAFRHVGGVMRVRYKNVPTKAHSLLVTFDKKVTGDFPLSWQEELPVAVMEEGESSVRIRFTPPAQGTNTHHFYVPLPTGNLSRYKLCFCDENDQPISGTNYEKTTDITVTRRKLIRLPGLVLTSLEAGIE